MSPGSSPVDRRERLASIDVLRGLVMVLMALDHARDYFSNLMVDPTDMATTTPALFATRWVTHPCAPVFVFLTGIGVFLYGRSRSRGEVSRYLVTRGLWLVVLELTVVRFGWLLSVTAPIVIWQVIAAIGVAMVVLGGLVWTGRWGVAAVGLALVLGHNVLDGVSGAEMATWAGVGWALVHEFALVNVGSQDDPFFLQIAYPVVPWIGVMCCGYALGPLYGRGRGREERRFLLVVLGLGACAAFVLVRLANGYGCPKPWEPQDTALRTALSFLNCEKYPPSLAYLLMTLGPALVFLGLAERDPGPVGRVLETYGRVPLFYYVLHIPLLAAAAGLMYQRQEGIFLTIPDFFAGRVPADYGRPLWLAYVAWIAVVAALYLPCRWYAGVKARSRSPLLTYL